LTDASKRDWVELSATLLLALAAVATTWRSYQAARWNGEQAKVSSAVNKTRIEAARASDLANAQQEVDVATFSQWVNAYARKEARLAGFYFKRFREEFKPAVNAWLATRPLENDGVPLTPFESRPLRRRAVFCRDEHKARGVRPRARRCCSSVGSCSREPPPGSRRPP
jgi:hypothetical protein